MNAKTPKRQGNKRGEVIILLCTLGVLASWRSSLGQESPTTQSTQTVYVSDSTTAVERMALADRMERLKEWNKAADLYQEVLEKYSDRVVPIGNQGSEATQYTTVATVVQDRVGKWPADGLRVYRARYEPTAKAMLENAHGDAAELSKIVSMYFATDSGKKAAIELMDVQLESGDFAAVAYTGQRLLSSHPNISAERPMVIYRSAIALHICGDDARAKAMLAELRQSSPQAIGVIAGKDTNLVESLTRELNNPVPTIARASEDSWPTYMGSFDRDRIGAGNAKASARIAKIDYAKPPYHGRGGNNAAQLKKDDDMDRDAGRMLGVMPVVDHGELFFTDGAKVYGVSIDSGFPLPGWSATYPQGGAYSAGTWPNPRDQQLSLTVTESSVLVPMGFPDKTLMQGITEAGPRSFLVCLDRESGKEKWKSIPASYEAAFANLKSAEFSGAPVVVGDSIFIAARSSKGNQFEDSHLVCLDAVTGKPKWSTYIASASNATAVWMDPSTVHDENAIHLAYSGGRVYACTNLGAVACVDAYSGRILWLNLYPRELPQDMNAPMGFRLRGMRAGMGGDTQSQQSRPWAFNPPIVDGGKIFVLPNDSKELFVYDAGNGREIKRLEMNDLISGDELAPDTLLNVSHDRLVVAGVSHVYCLNWQAYEHSKFDLKNLDNPAVIWPRQLAWKIMGRGFVTSDSLYLPTDERLVTINMRSGKITDLTPPFGSSWDHGQGRGNVIVSEGHVVIAGSTNLEIRTDLTLARAKLDAAVNANPNEAAPHLAYAETMFNAGQSDIALGQLDAAVGLVHTQKDRDRLFNLCMTSAQSSIAAPQLADQLFDRANSAATSADQKAHYLLARAKFCDSRKDKKEIASEVKLLQSVLDVPEMRGVNVTDEESGTSSSAASLAERRIDDLKKVNGAEIYADFESAAKTALSSAGPEPDVLLEIARRYPNSTSAPQAMLAAANFFETAHNYRMATQTLRQVSFKYPDAVDRAKLVEDLARNYLAMPGRAEAAVGRLMYGARVAPNAKLSKPIALPGGKTLSDVTFAQAAAALRESIARAKAQTLPDFHFPLYQRGMRREPWLAESPGQVIANVTNIVKSAVPYQRFDRVVVFQPGTGLSCFSIGSPTPMWTNAEIKESPKEAAWVENSFLSWRDDLLVMTGNKGESLWKLRLKDIAAPDAAAGDQVGEEPEAQVEAIVQPMGGPRPARIMRLQRQVIIQGNQQVIVPVMINGMGAGAVGGPEAIAFVKPVSDRVLVATSAGRVLALSPGDGHVIWQMRLGSQGIDAFVANDEFVAARYADNSQIHLMVMDANDGLVTYRKSYAPDAHAPMNLALSLEGMLVYTTYDRICGKDLYDPSSSLTYEVAPESENSPVFLGMAQPDQLELQGDHILAVATQGAYVRVHSLYDGKAIKTRDNVEMMQPTGVSSETNVHLRTCGASEFYAFSPRSLMQYDVSEQKGWSPNLPAQINHGFRDLFVGSDYLLVEANSFGKESVRAFWRGKDANGHEAGLWVYDKKIENPAGVREATGVEGGVYYLAGDNTLHFLKGSRAE